MQLDHRTAERQTSDRPSGAQAQVAHAPGGPLREDLVQPGRIDSAAQELGIRRQHPLKSADLLPHDPPPPQAEPGGELGVRGNVIDKLRGRHGVEAVGLEHVEHRGAQRFVQAPDQRLGEVQEQPEREVGLDQALRPVRRPQALIEVPQRPDEALGADAGIDSGVGAERAHGVESGDALGAHPQQFHPRLHGGGLVGVLGVARAGDGAGEGDHAQDGLHVRGGLRVGR